VTLSLPELLWSTDASIVFSSVAEQGTLAKILQYAGILFKTSIHMSKKSATTKGNSALFTSPVGAL
jgi:hypothetical protein